MGERDDARHQVEQRRERIGALAHEVSRRMTPEYAKERAMEMARHKAYEVRERAVDNGWLMPLIGAGVGALLGKALQSKAQTGREERWYGREDARYGYGTSGSRDVGYREAYGAPYGEYRTSGSSYVPERERGFDAGVRSTEGGDSSGLADKASEKASEVKERVSAMADDYGNRLRDQTHALRDRMPDREAISTSAREDMGVWAFGALALGALFGMALPVSDREREMLEPAKRKLHEAGQQARDLAMEKGSEALDRAQAKVGGDDERHDDARQETRTTQSPIIPTTTVTTPIH